MLARLGSAALHCMQVINKPAADCRLFERELDYIVNHAKDQFLILDITFIDIMLKLQQKLPSIKGFIILTDRKHMPSDCKLRNVMCYEDMLEVSLVTFCSQRCCCRQTFCTTFSRCLYCCTSCNCCCSANNACFLLQAQISHLPFRWHVKDENLACGLCYTSGTTGNPKVTKACHTHCVQNARHVHDSTAL